MKNLLIGESGGTKTDWCFITDSKKSYFTTESYHPRNFTSEFISKQHLFWSNYSELENCEIHFYGSGCFKVEAQAKMRDYLNQIGLENTNVNSDLLGASIALGLNGNWGAIAGTGSVVFRADNENIIELRGGLGRELGDEGSGYYFGKLLIEALHSNQLDVTIQQEIESLIKYNEESQLPKLVEKFKDNQSILKIHKTNISMFVEKYLDSIDLIHFCGSYAFYNQDIFSETLIENGIKPGLFIERPLHKIVDFHLGL